MNMELIYKIGLTLIPGIGDVNGKKLVSYCGGVEAIFKEKKAALLKIQGIRQTTLNAILKQTTLLEAEKEMKFMNKFDVEALFYLDHNYPLRLRNCDDSPLMLYYKGTADLNSKKILSIVGTRKVTTYGKKMCREIIEQFAGSGVIIISGLAYGVDTCAHQNSIKNDLATIGALAHGLDRIYPAQNRTLAEKMVKSGGLLTEFRSGSKPDRENFPKRNRIIAGISDATLVVESAIKGGAMITADIANSYHRDVFAIPGRIHDDYSEGCNFLIKKHKASIIQSADDIKYLLAWDSTPDKKVNQLKLFLNLDDNSQALIKIIQENEPIGIDQINLMIDLPLSQIVSLLLELEFEGILECLPGKVYKMI